MLNRNFLDMGKCKIKYEYSYIYYDGQNIDDFLRDDLYRDYRKDGNLSIHEEMSDGTIVMIVPKGSYLVKENTFGTYEFYSADEFNSKFEKLVCDSANS